MRFWGSKNKQLVLTLGLLGGISACTNIGTDSDGSGTNSQSASTSSGSSDSSTDTSGGSTTGGTIITITKVIRSQSDPVGSVDIIGDGSGSIGRYCIDQGGTDKGSAFGGSTCNCVFKYNTSSGGTESPAAGTTYYESDMIRCRYDTVVPSGIDTLTVKIEIPSIGLSSNERSITLSSGATEDADGNEILDHASINSFREVMRYQCRENVTINIPGNWGGDFYDPFQSANSALTYPLNFYHTNLGRAITAYRTKSGESADFYSAWECNFNEAGTWDHSNSVTDNSNVGTKSWENFAVWSEGATNLTGAIYHPTKGTKTTRSSFLLARGKSGSVFNVPFNALVGPQIITQEPAEDDDGSNIDPIGYAARPDYSKSDGSEPCPSDKITIPTGYKWVKVWAFRASLPTRFYVNGANAITTGQVACNPGTWADHGSIPEDSINAGTFADNDHVFDSCNTAVGTWEKPDGTPGQVPPHPDGPGENNGTNSPGHGNDSNAWCYNCTPDTTRSDFAAVYEQPEPEVYRVYWANSDSLRACQKLDFSNTSPFLDEWNTAGSSGDSWESGGATPGTTVFTTTDYDQGESRFDYVFVVTDQTVKRQDMKDRASGTDDYYPWRVTRRADCTTSTDPTTCSINLRRYYNLWLNEVFQQEDPDGNFFPLCAIQKDPL